MTNDDIGSYLGHAQTYLHMARAELHSNKPAILAIQELDMKLEKLIAEFSPSEEFDEFDPEQESEEDTLDSDDDFEFGDE
jgi:hypothetical protein